jgi:hypothetical protein
MLMLGPFRLLWRYLCPVFDVITKILWGTLGYWYAGLHSRTRAATGKCFIFTNLPFLIGEEAWPDASIGLFTSRTIPRIAPWTGQ